MWACNRRCRKSLLFLLFVINLCLELLTLKAWAQPEVTCLGKPASWQPGQTIKVMTWNVQFLAGGIYEIWNDKSKLKPLDVKAQLSVFQEVIDLIERENPDILLLQEVDIDPRVAMDQVQWFRDYLAEQFRCSAHTSYTRLNGHASSSVRTIPGGLQLLTLSRYKMNSAVRHDLPAIPDQSSLPLTFQRAVLDTEIELGDFNLKVLNTHLDAFAQGLDVMQRQVKALESRLDGYKPEEFWLLGGDFNLIPQGQINFLNAEEKHWYQADSELVVLTNKFPVIPSVEQATGPDRIQWLTQATRQDLGFDRTLDYLFHSPLLKPVNAYVIRKGAEHLSDHLPVVVEFVEAR